MSMKARSRGRRFPMQDEHETGKNGVGVARPGADTDAECREPEPGTNPRVSTKQRADPVRGRGSVRALQLGGSAAGRAELWGVRQGRAGPGAGLRAENDGVERGADHALDPGVFGSRQSASPAVPAAPIRVEVHGRRHRVVGGSGPSAWTVERTRHAAHFAASPRAVRRATLRTAGEDQRGALVQPAGEWALSQSGGGVRANAVQHCGDRAAAQTRSAGPAGLFASGYGASRRSRRCQGGISHQCRGHSDAMAGGGLRREDQREVSATGAGSGISAISLYHSRFSRRQRVRVHPSSGGGNVAEAARRVHQEPGVPEPGQCAGGGQERRGDSQADRLRTHCVPTCRSLAEVLRRALESVAELSPALRLRHSELGPARKTATPIQDRRLPDSVRKTTIASRSGTVFETRGEFAGTGKTGVGDQRHRVCSADDRGQDQAAAAKQNSVVAEVRLTPQGGRGNAGSVESVENKSGFPTFPPAPRDDDNEFTFYNRTQGKEVGRYAASSFF